MAAPPARARADYDYLIKLLLIGDSGKFFCVGNVIIFIVIPSKKRKRNMGIEKKFDL